MKTSTMRLSFRFVIPLVIALGVLALVVVPLVDRLMAGWAYRDLDTRAAFVANTLEEPIAGLSFEDDRARITTLLERAIRDERLYGIALCDINNQPVAQTATYIRELGCSPRISRAEDKRDAKRDLYISARELHSAGRPIGRLVMLHDTSFVGRRSDETRWYIVGLFVVLGVLIALITVFVAHLSWRGWLSGVRAMLRGEGVLRPFQQQVNPEVEPLVADLRKLVRELDRDRRFREDTTIRWEPETLRLILREQLFGDEVIVVSNREPYIHEHTSNGVIVKRPASGLVTAVEPVMRACSGTWIAHGSGSADREVCDRTDHVQVPPDDPRYTLRRIWLTPEEERGYYYGFANEGLWPLCHIAHVRPVFRNEDWEQYVRVNQRFADAVVAEARTPDPVVLVQDYHFALLPKMIREQLPRATIITFWHIPWPNPESFGICPWRNELLEGMLGSSILGFHTTYHCKNFLETVDRFMETRVIHEESTVTYRGFRTRVCDYPISIHWNGPKGDPVQTHAIARASVRERLELPSEVTIALGVDRLDYTKGIVERFNGVERMLEKHPDLIGKFTLVQIAAPSRSSLEEYQAFEKRVRDHVDRINARFAPKTTVGAAVASPITLLIEQHTSEQVDEYYRACDMCVVTSLHDGMNLVSKEFVAARDDEKGVLILSRFAGAAGELSEALIVNPYHIEQVADALYQAVTMSVEEQRVRMRSLRTLVKDFNIYRWAGRMLLDASRERLSMRIRDRIGRYAETEETVT
ncbi:MAG TPA: trehalose-6-phosphate synthase [Burkholderiaceae bacterium]|nr:trehalose-6-phosphate synthase [Burkholderiaceae bacterium]